MSTLLISRVDSIEVVQVGKSKLSFENKSEDAGTVEVSAPKKGAFDGVGFVKSATDAIASSAGGNRTVDLGKGKRTLSLKIFVTDRKDNDALFNILYEKRYCKITDKFKGEISVFVRNVDVIDDDTHVDRTIFDIKASVEDLPKAAKTNFTAKLKGLTDATENSSLPEKIKEIVELVLAGKDDEDSKEDSALKEVTNVGDVFKFADPSIEKLNEGLNSVLDLRTDTVNSLSRDKERLLTPVRIKKTITNLADFPDEFLKLTTDLASSPKKKEVSKTVAVFTAPNKLLRDTDVVKLPISIPRVRDEDFSNFRKGELSQIEEAELKLETVISRLLNEVKLLSDINAILAGGFSTRASFDETVDQIILRLNHVGYSDHEISSYAFIIKSFANTQDYPDTVVIHITAPRPLVKIVYDRYGNLDNYVRIEALNGFKDNDYISGQVTVFE